MMNYVLVYKIPTGCKGFTTFTLIEEMKTLNDAITKYNKVSSYAINPVIYKYNSDRTTKVRV